MKDLESNSNYIFVEGDINNKLLFQETLEKFKISVIFHLAAQTHVDRSFRDVDDFIEANIHGTYSLLEVLRYMKEKPLFIYYGTDEILGDAPEEKFYTEEDRLIPQNPYSATKASAEMACHCYYHSFKVPIIIVRSMNMVGPYQHPEKLIAKIITHALQDKPFTLYKGESIRGWTYVEDSCEAVDLLWEKGRVGQTYHIPAATYKSVPEVAKSILQIMGKENLLTGFQGQRLKDDFRYALDGSKLINELKWTPPTSWEEAIKKTIEWYKQNPWFWERYLRNL